MSGKQAKPGSVRSGSEAASASAVSTAVGASWTVYLVECRDGSLYAGCTTDVQRRLAQHNAGRGGAYTRSRRPVTVRYARPCATESEAKRLEAAIKAWSRRRKLDLCQGLADPSA